MPMAAPSEVECVFPAGDICGEGAIWHPEEQALYWTDINRFLIHRLNAEDRSVKTWTFDEPVTSMNLTSDPGQLLVVFGSKVGLWSPATHPAVQTIYRLSEAPGMRFNDAGVDPRGSLWAGTMRNNVGPKGEDLDVTFTGGVLYRIDPDGKATKWRQEIGISNTVAWSPDNTYFYFGDSVANSIHRFDYDIDTGAILGKQPFLVGYERGAPDGSAMDADGFLWNTRPGAGCLIRIAPDGSVDRVVALPVPNPTTCAFGGEDFKTLYITSARTAERLSGGLFALRTETPGVAKSRFGLR
jgi:sugar lactone lactonase YvrE